MSTIRTQETVLGNKASHVLSLVTKFKMPYTKNLLRHIHRDNNIF